MKPDQEMLETMVRVRDSALRALRQAEAFTVVALVAGEPRTFRFAATMEHLGKMQEAARRFRRTPLNVWEQP